MNGQFKFIYENVNKKMKTEIKEEKPELIFERMKLKIENEALFVEKGWSKKLKEMFEFFDEIKETFNVSSKEAIAVLSCLEKYRKNVIYLEAVAYQIKKTCEDKDKKFLFKFLNLFSSEEVVNFLLRNSIYSSVIEVQEIAKIAYYIGFDEAIQSVRCVSKFDDKIPPWLFFNIVDKDKEKFSIAIKVFSSRQLAEIIKMFSNHKMLRDIGLCLFDIICYTRNKKAAIAFLDFILENHSYYDSYEKFSKDIEKIRKIASEKMEGKKVIKKLKN